MAFRSIACQPHGDRPSLAARAVRVSERRWHSETFKPNRKKHFLSPHSAKTNLPIQGGSSFEDNCKHAQYFIHPPPSTFPKIDAGDRKRKSCLLPSWRPCGQSEMTISERSAFCIFSSPKISSSSLLCLTHTPRKMKFNQSTPSSPSGPSGALATVAIIIHYAFLSSFTFFYFIFFSSRVMFKSGWHWQQRCRLQEHITEGSLSLSRNLSSSSLRGNANK